MDALTMDDLRAVIVQQHDDMCALQSKYNKMQEQLIALGDILRDMADWTKGLQEEQRSDNQLFRLCFMQIVERLGGLGIPIHLGMNTPEHVAEQNIRAEWSFMLSEQLTYQERWFDASLRASFENQDSSQN